MRMEYRRLRLRLKCIVDFFLGIMFVGLIFDEVWQIDRCSDLGIILIVVSCWEGGGFLEEMEIGGEV